jgi:glycine dehydrogenase
MMGWDGLKKATQVAILNANYMKHELEKNFKTLYSGATGRVAHELILDTREFKKSCGIEAEDIAKRLMDYGFHSPTLSFPVAGTLMIEPTESEDKEEMDRFINALNGIYSEIKQVENGEVDAVDNVLKNAPHICTEVCGDEWSHPYLRSKAAYPTTFTLIKKFWPTVGRVDSTYGDRNLVCACLPMEAYMEA